MTSKQLTQRVEEALAAAHGQAVALGNASLEPAHVALAMVQADQSLLSQLARTAVGDVNPLRDALAALVNDLPTLGSPGGQLSGSANLQALFAQAQTLAEQAGDEFIAEDWIVLAFFQDQKLPEVLRRRASISRRPQHLSSRKDRVGKWNRKTMKKCATRWKNTPKT